MMMFLAVLARDIIKWLTGIACLLVAATTIACADCGSPDGPDAVVATYDNGGQVTVREICDALANPDFLWEADATDRLTVGNIQAIARHIACRKICLDVAKSLRVDETPDYLLEAKFIESRVLVDVLRQDVQDEVARVPVTQEEIAAYMDKNRAAFAGAEQIRAERIVISKQPIGEQAARKRAAEALSRINAGQDFATVAGIYSDIHDSAGQPRTYPMETWSRENWITLVNLGAGKVSDVLSTDTGFEIVKVHEIMPMPGYSKEEAAARALKMLQGERVYEKMRKLGEEAAAAYPIDCDAAKAVVEKPEDGKDTSTDVVVKCGKFALTASDVKVICERHAVRSLDCSQLIGYANTRPNSNIALGELARSRGIADRPQFKAKLQFALDSEKIRSARMWIIDQWLSEMKFSEAEIKDYYDRKWTATVDPMLDFDAILVPLKAGGANRAEAEQTARKIIEEAGRGEALESLVSRYEGVEYMAPSRRVVMEGSDIASLVNGLQPGQVVSQPYEDFGSLCVIRVLNLQRRQKMPYETAKIEIQDLLRREQEDKLRADFEKLLLEKNHFKFDSTSAEKMGKGG